jgi:predicted nucleic acid-binding protein
MKAIFHSSALVSLINADDSLHTDALSVREVVNRFSYDLLLPYEVLAETLNVLGRRIGREYATRADATLVSMHEDSELRFVASTPGIVGRALTLQASAKGGPSFVDCLVMAYAHVNATEYNFGFDATFKKNGYQLPGESASASHAA